MNEKLCTTLVRARAAMMFDEVDEHHESLPCENCGNWTNQLERHHRKFRSRGGIWVPSNVLLLCRYCHQEATREAPWIPGSGLNVHTWEEPDEVPVKVHYFPRPVLLADDGSVLTEG